jgi:hypothetical protein
VLVCSIDERIPTERITSIHRSPDTVGEGIAQMSFETRERLLPEYFPTVVSGLNRTSTTPALDREFYLDHNVIEMIGEFEYLLLSAAASLGEEAYGASIRQQIETATGRRCSIGALYTTLDRLERRDCSRPGWAKRLRSGAGAPSEWFV